MKEVNKMKNTSNEKEIKEMGKVEKKYRVILFYMLDEPYIYSIPVSSLYEAVLVGETTIFSNTLKESHTGDSDCTLAYAVERYNEEQETWEPWLDEKGSDDITAYLKVNEPNQYKTLNTLSKHIEVVVEAGVDETIDYDEVVENWSMNVYED